MLGSGIDNAHDVCTYMWPYVSKVKSIGSDMTENHRRLVELDVKIKKKVELVDSLSIIDDLVSICGAHNLLDLVI